MGIFDWIKNAAGTIWNGIKEGAGGVIDVGNKIKDGIKSGWEFVKGIPVIGNLVDKGLDKLKIGGMGVKDIAGMASDALDVGNQINGYINPKQATSASSNDEQIARIQNQPKPVKADDPKKIKAMEADWGKVVGVKKKPQTIQTKKSRKKN